jgi:tetratricopeptide (TPR) repeat protein
VVDELEEVPATGAGAGSARAIARIRAAIQLSYFGDLGRTDALLDGCEHEPGAEGDSGVLAWLCDAAYDRAITSGQPVHPSRFLRGRELYAKLGDRRGAVVQTGHHVLTLATLGAVEEALAALPAYEREAAEIGFQHAKFAAAWARAACALAQGDTEPFLRLLPPMRSSIAAGRMAAGVGLWLAELLVVRGRVDEAAGEVKTALRSALNVPVYRGGLLAVSSMIKLRRGDLEGALDDSGRALECAEGAVPLGSAYTPSLARYEALQAAGLGEEARVVLQAAAATLTLRATSLREYGPGYLERGWRTAEVLRLAREHGVAP